MQKHRRDLKKKNPFLRYMYLMAHDIKIIKENLNHDTLDDAQASILLCVGGHDTHGDTLRPKGGGGGEGSRVGRLHKKNSNTKAVI